jgi:type I restriction enzyme R subunit
MNPDLAEPEVLLKYILTLELEKCDIEVCIASGEPDDKAYRFRRIIQSPRLVQKFREAVAEALKKYRQELDENNIELREFAAETSKPEQEVEYLNILPYDSIKQQIEPVEHYLDMQHFQHDERNFIKKMRFYVIHLQPPKGPPINFFQRYSPSQMLSQSPFFAATWLQQDLYDDLVQPTFLFERHIDCLSCEEHMFILQKHSFFKIFSIKEYAHAENFVVTAERLDYVANDIVRHFMQRGYMGKAIVICINKITAVRTYNRVQERWRAYREELEAQLAQESDPDAKFALTKKIDYMKSTDIAVVVSSSEGDVERFAKFSAEYGEQVEILPHHQRFKNEKLDEDFKNSAHPLRIAFVCAMWITGFDVPCLSTIYLDRPLKGHTLMQTIARANRVYQDKNNGLIVDYASNKDAQNKALAIYAHEDSSYQEGDRPIGDKSDLVQELRKVLARTEQFCHEQGIDIQKLQAEWNADTLRRSQDKLRRQALVDGVVNTLVAYDELKLNALLLTSEVSKLYNAILPDATEPEFTLPVHLFRLIKDGIFATMRPDNTDYFRAVQGKVTRLVRESMEIAEQEERFSPDTHEPRGQFDLRDIDLAALSTNLRSGHRHINSERWRNALYERIKRMIEVNPSEIKYMEKLERAVQRYNEGCANFASDPRLINPQEKIRAYPGTTIELEQLEDEYVDALVELTGAVAREEQRPEQEGLSVAEIAIFDLLTNDASLAEEERTQVKEIAHSLLAKLHATFDNVPDWQKKQDIHSRVYVIIEDELCNLPPVYTKDLFDQKRDALFLYVQEHYKNDGSISVA